jgi:hypothetical protein
VLLSFILLPVRRRTTLEATLVAMPSTSAINHGNDTEDSAGALVFVDFVAIPKPTLWSPTTGSDVIMLWPQSFSLL